MWVDVRVHVCGCVCVNCLIAYFEQDETVCSPVA
jgi:hypothetical protein